MTYMLHENMLYVTRFHMMEHIIAVFDTCVKNVNKVGNKVVRAISSPCSNVHLCFNT